MEKIAEVIQLRPLGTWCFRIETRQLKSYHALYKYRLDLDGEDLIVVYTVKVPLRTVFKPHFGWTFLAWEAYSPFGRMFQGVKRFNSIDEAEDYVLALISEGGKV